MAIVNLTCFRHPSPTGNSRCTICGDPATHTAIDERLENGRQYQPLCTTHAAEFCCRELGIDPEPAAAPAAARVQPINKARKARTKKGAA